MTDSNPPTEGSNGQRTAEDAPVSRAEFEHLKARVKALETQGGGDESGVGNGTLDHRDEAVISTLHPGEVVTAGKLRKLYITKTDIRDRSVAVERVRGITKRDCFDSAGHGKWRFRGGGE